YACFVRFTRIRRRRSEVTGRCIAGANSALDRNDLPRYAVAGPLPSGYAQRGSEFYVGSMRALPHHRGSRSENCGRLIDAESLLLQQNERDSVLLRHPGGLHRHDPYQVAGRAPRLPVNDGRRPGAVRALPLRSPKRVPAGAGAGTVSDQDGPSVKSRTTSAVGDVPGLRAGKCTIGSPQDASITQHDLQAATHAEVIEVRGVAGALVERVPNNAAFRRPRGRVHHENMAPPTQLIVHLLVGYAGLDRGEAESFVDLEDALHARANIDDDVRAGRSSGGRSPGSRQCETVESDTVIVRDANNLPHVCGRGRVHDTRRASIPTRQ